MQNPDLISLALGFAFTIMILSYILGDNPFFRFAIYLFVGVTAGFAVAIALRSVLWPQLLLPLLTGTRDQRLFSIFPLLLSSMLLLKVSPRLAPYGNPAMAYLVGVGAATAIGGGLLGTLFPQTLATINAFDLSSAPGAGGALGRLFEGALLLLGVVTTLIYFQFTARNQQAGSPQRSPLIESIAWVGGVFIAIAFGSLFAGIFSAALAALVDRANFLVQFVLQIFSLL